MATIGKKAGVAKIFRVKIRGFPAWFLWWSFYLSKLPTLKKKFKVISDWSVELIFSSDVSMIKGYVEEKHDADLDNKKNKNIEDKSKINIDI